MKNASNCDKYFAKVFEKKDELNFVYFKNVAIIPLLLL